MSAPKKRGLGRGLEALLGPKAAETPPPEAQPGEALRTLPVAHLQPGKYQPRMQMDASKLTEHFGDRVFRTIVPRNVRLAEAPSHGQSIVGYDRASRGGVAYLGLAGEVIRRQFERERGAAPAEAV